MSHYLTRFLTLLLTTQLGCNFIGDSDKNKTKELRQYLPQGKVTLGEPEIIGIAPPIETSLEEAVQNYRAKHKGEFTQPIIYIEKRKRILTVYLCNLTRDQTEVKYSTVDDRCESIKSFPISLGHNPVGDKERQGDKRTPESTISDFESDFYITEIKMPGNSKYYAAMTISYPTPAHAEKSAECLLNPNAICRVTKAQKQQIRKAYESCSKPPGNTGLGGGIQIHGLGGDPNNNWTHGCIAPSNNAMDQLLNRELGLVRTGCQKYKGKRVERTKVIIRP